MTEKSELFHHRKGQYEGSGQFLIRSLRDIHAHKIVLPGGLDIRYRSIINSKS